MIFGQNHSSLKVDVVYETSLSSTSRQLCITLLYFVHYVEKNQALFLLELIFFFWS